MVMTKPLATAPIHLADMTRQEAETVTEQIKQNFDSLGNMLIAARDRKAYKALGYRTFDAYCRNELGKSSSTAYEAIENEKVRSQLEAYILDNQGGEVTLRFPSSHLRPLKKVEGVENKLKVIEYAQKLAEKEGKTATKQHLEIAVFEITDKRSEDFRNAIQKLGFSKGVQVEIASPLKKERGIVTKIDKIGKIYVEHYYGSNKAIDYDATQLRILTNEEKPTNPLGASVASKGDKVVIYSDGLQGKKGTIYSWKEGKTALVKLDERDNDSPILVAYAEMELVQPELHSDNWETDITWNTTNNTAYYFTAATDRIHCSKWPVGLYIQPYHSKIGPVQTMEKWEENHSLDLMKALATPANTKALALAQAMDLPETEGKEFVADLISSLLQLFPNASPDPLSPKSLGISFAQTIDELISGKKTQTRRAWQDDYAKNFIRYFDENIPIPALNKGRHRGGHEIGFIRLTQRPYQQYLSEMSASDLREEGGMVATTQEFIDTFFEGQDKLVWVLHFEFLPSHSGSEAEALLHENERLREQLLEAETTIGRMLQAVTSLEEKLEPVEAEIDFLPGGDDTSNPDAAVSADIPGSEAEISAPENRGGNTNFLVKNTSQISAPGDTIAHTDLNATFWTEILEANHFVPVPYRLKGFFKGSWRGWKFFFHVPHGGVIAIDIANEKEEMFTHCTEVNFDIDLDDEDKIIEWVKRLINEIEDFCPGQLSLFSTPDIVSVGREIEIAEELSPEVSKNPDAAVSTHIPGSEAETSAPENRGANTDFSVENISQIPDPEDTATHTDTTVIPTIRERVFTDLEKERKNFSRTRDAKKRQKLKRNIRQLEEQLNALQKFSNSQIGDHVTKTHFPEERGTIKKLEISPGGMPLAWVEWNNNQDEGETSTLDYHPLSVLTIQDKKEK